MAAAFVTGTTNGFGLPGTFAQFNRSVDCWMVPSPQ